MVLNIIGTVEKNTIVQYYSNYLIITLQHYSVIYHSVDT